MSEMKINNFDNKKFEKPVPRGFFTKIGIAPFSNTNNEQFQKKARKAAGRAVADRLKELVVHKNHAASLYLAFSNLELTKLWYGNSMVETCRIARELSLLSIPENARILDIGGGPGALAFWMAHIWDDCRVTVADQFPDTGRQWAHEIGTDNVNFVNSLLPDLPGILDNSYDVILLSRVLHYLKELRIPTHGLGPDDYLKSPGGQLFERNFGTLLDRIKSVMAPGGHLVIVEQWSEAKACLTQMIMEQNGLYIDDKFSDGNRVSQDNSCLSFSSANVTSGEIKVINSYLAA